MLDELAHAGSHGGFLPSLPTESAERLLSDAIRIVVPAGSLLSEDLEHPRVVVVIDGLLRVFLRSADGRQVTVRYARSGDVAGLAILLGGPGPTSIQAMTTAAVAALRVGTLRSLLASDPRVARACAEEMTRQLYRALDDLSDQAFRTVRQRVVRHLLDLAVVDEGRRPVVRASQQELADAVGSVREVVTRALRGLQEEGSIRTARDEVVLLDPIALHEEILETATEASADRPRPHDPRR